MKVDLNVIRSADKLPPYEHPVLVRAYRDSWDGGPEWFEAIRYEASDYDFYPWYWSPSNFDEFTPEEVDYWAEIPLKEVPFHESTH